MLKKRLSSWNDFWMSGLAFARLIAAGRRLRTVGRATCTNGRIFVRTIGSASFTNGSTAGFAPFSWRSGVVRDVQVAERRAQRLERRPEDAAEGVDLPERGARLLERRRQLRDRERDVRVLRGERAEHSVGRGHEAADRGPGVGQRVGQLAVVADQTLQRV